MPPSRPRLKFNMLPAISVHDHRIGDDFKKPYTVGALRAFDPLLRLAWNRVRKTFSLYREVRRASRIRIGGQRYVVIETALVHVSDGNAKNDGRWGEGLDANDNPYPLIAWLFKSDTVRHPELLTDAFAADRLQEHQARIRARIQDNWRHATRENMRQLLPAWEPFYDFSGWVR